MYIINQKRVEQERRGDRERGGEGEEGDREISIER
jgi:hypothetical protein